MTNKRAASSSPDNGGRVLKDFKSTPSRDPALVLFSDRPTPLPQAGINFITSLCCVFPFSLGDSYSSDTETWIGHLQKHFEIRSPEEPQALRVHNYAVWGDTVEDDLNSQLERFYEEFPTAQSLEDSNRAMFSINDCGGTDADELEPIVEQIFDAMHDLYVKWKARSFLLINVPPMGRSPAGAMDMTAERYDNWNQHVLEQATSFASSATKASVFVVSAHRIISDILDNPEEFDLDNSSAEEEGSEESFGDDKEEANVIWKDDLHLSSAVHRVFADRILKVFDFDSVVIP